MLIDLHVHTCASPCSRLPLDEIISNAAACGLNGVCITDHHSVDALRHIVPGKQSNGLQVFVGQEYSTRHGDFLIFGPQAPLPAGLSAEQLMADVARQNGIAVAAHPFRPQRAVSEFIIRKGLCRIVESVNGRNSPAANHDVEQWRRRYNLVECAGSDAHTLEELGKAKTRFQVPIHTTDDLIHALKKGLCIPA